MVPQCEEETRRIYYMSYVREQAVLSFTHRTEQESKKKEKTVVCKEQIIGPAHMRFVDRKKRERKKRETETKLHLFIYRRKNRDAQEQKISRFFLQNF